MKQKLAQQARTLRIEDAAREVGICPASYYSGVKRGELPAIRVGRRLLVPRELLDRLLAGEGEQR